MGGNALKNTKTRRYLRDEYLILKDRIINMLKSNPIFENRKINDIQAYSEKESFGDMDLLVSSTNLPDNTWDIVKEIFSPNQLVRNGSCTSFDVNELQIDMILAPDNEYDITAIYYSYNDLGNLMGRVSHNLGFKYGHDGLTYRVRNELRDIIEEINVTMNPKEIFDFLGYSFERYQSGFKNLDEIFEFSISTPYFNKAYYVLEDRNYASRIRDQKRSTYKGFLAWIENNERIPTYDYKERKQEHLQRAFDTFPSFKQKYEDAVIKGKRIELLKSKFTGDLVSDITGLSGVPLGQWIQAFKKATPDFNNWVIDTPINEIQETIARTHKSNSIILEPKEPPKYGRDKVRELTGFDGRKLSIFMNDFKQKWPTVDAFENWLAKVEKQELESNIKKAASSFEYNF